MNINYQGGNIYNKYTSKNLLVRKLMNKYFEDLNSLITPIKEEIDSAIEIGCGEGYITQYINDMGINIEGADIYEQIINVASNLHPSIEFHVRSIYELTRYDNTYDLVLATEVLEHLDHPERAVQEMSKVSNQYVFISVPNDALLRLANITRLKYLEDLGNTPGHINHWSKNNFREFLEQQGLNEVQLKCSTLWLMALCDIKTHPE